MGNFFTKLFGGKSAPQTAPSSAGQEEFGINVQKVIVGRWDDPDLIGALQPLSRLKTEIPNRSTELETLQSYSRYLYQQVQNNGKTHLPLGDKHRVSAWVYGDRSSDDWVEMVIVEEKVSPDLWLFSEIKVRGEGHLSYVMLLELPCCKGETSVLFQARSGEKYDWKFIPSKEALVADIGGKLRSRNVQIEPIAYDVENRLFDEILMHLKGETHDCTSKDKFGAAYREPQ